MMMHKDHGTIIHYISKVEGMQLWPTMYRTDLNVLQTITDKYFGHETEKMDTSGD